MVEVKYEHGQGFAFKNVHNGKKTGHIHTDIQKCQKVIN